MEEEEATYMTAVGFRTDKEASGVAIYFDKLLLVRGPTPDENTKGPSAEMIEKSKELRRSTGAPRAISGAETDG